MAPGRGGQQGEASVRAEAREMLRAMAGAAPALVVFDLDYTLWPFWCEVRSRQSMPTLYPQARSVIEALKETGIPMAVASRTPTPDTARVFLDKLALTDSFVDMEIYPSRTHKTDHFRSIQQKTGVPYSSMIFFDDENRNIVEITRLGVTCLLVEDGVTLEAFQTALHAFKSKPSKKSNMSS
eukprot:SM000108S14226  [mRNA]  locus=s108:455467:456556:+ [translate_table: standard]